MGGGLRKRVVSATQRPHKHPPDVMFGDMLSAGFLVSDRPCARVCVCVCVVCALACVQARGSVCGRAVGTTLPATLAQDASHAQSKQDRQPLR